MPRNFGTSPGFVWLGLRAGKDLRVGPRPTMAAQGANGPQGKAGTPPDRPWVWNVGVEVNNLTNHNNPGLPVGAIAAQPCVSTGTAPCSCPTGGASGCPLAPSQYFGRSLSLANDFSPITASNRTIRLRTSFTF